MGLRSYMYDDLQLRRLLKNRSSLYVTLAILVFLLIAQLALIYGRPRDEEYWLDYTGDDRLGNIVENVTFCERVRTDEFVRAPLNSLSSYCFIAAGVFCWTLFVLDVRGENKLFSGAGFDHASLILRQPVWSFTIGLGFVYLGIAQFLFYASLLEVTQSVFAASRWTMILIMVACAIVRMLDFPVRKHSPRQKYRGWLVTYGFVLVIFGLSIGLAYRLDLLETDGIPNLVSYGMVVAGVVACMIHWRFHALSVKAQPVLIFFAGILALLSEGATFYDSPDSPYCNPDSSFQLEAIWSLLMSAAGILVYLFYRADTWNEEGFGQTPMDEVFMAQDEEDDDQDNARHRLPSAQSQQSDGQEIIRRPTSRSAIAVIRRTTENVVNSRYVTPENGFSAAQIRAAELIIGTLLTSFVIVVIYITFSGSWLD